jgi:phage-related protein (TIGR01555 family)
MRLYQSQTAQTGEMWIPDYDLAEKYQNNGLFSKIIDRPAEEALKHGMEYNVSDADLREFLDDALDRLDWEEKAVTAIRWARLFGGSIIVMLLDDGGGLEEPVNWQDVRSVEELRVYERAIVQPDPDTYRTGKAEYFDVSSTYGGTFRVHRSRCLVFKNGSLPEYGAAQQYYYWGLPEYIRIHKDLSRALKTHTNAANMIEKSVQPVYKQKNLQSTLAAEGGDTAVLKRLNVIDQARGMLNSIAVDMDGEDYDFKTFQMTGAKEILESTCNLLSAVTCIPQTILFGRSPAGENATGESDLENYYNFVEGIQKRMLKKNIRTLIKAIVQAGVYDGSIENPGNIKPTFKPLWSLSETEKATVELTKAQRAQVAAQTAQLYIDMQAIQPDEVRQALAKDEQVDVESILDNQPENPQDDGWAALLEGLEVNDNPIPDTAGQPGRQGGIMNPETAKDGGEGSGNFNHEGRPGKVGGSGGGGSSSKLSSKSMPAKKYVTSDGKMDVDTLRKDYDEFTQEMDEGCRTYLKQSMDSVEFKSAKLTEDSPFGYSPSRDAIYYDTSQKSIQDIDLSIVTTHELAHRIDNQFVNVAENEDFRQKVSNSKKQIDADRKKFQQFCKEDKEGFISDICSAISEGKYSFRYEHPEEYWKKEGNKEKEIFANYYSLVAFRDIPKLDFLKKNLPEVYESCEKIKRQLQGEDD